MIKASLVFKGLSVDAILKVGQITISAEHSRVTFTVLKFFEGGEDPFDSQALSFDYVQGVDVVEQCDSFMVTAMAN